jgi:hypothetical protein
MKRLLDILNLPLTNLIKEEYKNIKDSKHSPVYRKSGVEGFAPLFSFFSVNLGKGETKMKPAYKLLFVLFVFVFATSKSNAQAIKPEIDFAVMDPDNPLIANQIASIIVHVKIKSCVTSNDTGDVVGHLSYNLQTDSMGAVNGDTKLHIDQNPPYENIPPGGKFDTLDFIVDTNYFRTQETNPVNVIIIWPAFSSPSNPQCDSGEVIMWNVPGSQIGIYEEGPQMFGSTVFPNPAQSMQLVFIDSKYSKEVSRVSIMNNLGQVMNIHEFAEGEDSKGYILPTDDLRSGLYNIHIVYRDNKSEVVKFLKN